MSMVNRTKDFGFSKQSKSQIGFWYNSESDWLRKTSFHPIKIEMVRLQPPTPKLINILINYLN